jgi:hypothetical protein
MDFGAITLSSYNGVLPESRRPGQDASHPGTGGEGAAAREQSAQKKTSSANPESRLSEEQKQQVAELRQRDREVKSHEAAHMGAGGGLVRGGATYSYQAGPDGKRYAVGGEVSIDTSPIKNNPEATIAKMQRVRSAALAPADPSGQDRSVAAAASAVEAQARQELNKAQSGQAAGGEPKSEPKDKTAATGKDEVSRRQYNDKGSVEKAPAEATVIDVVA